MNISKSDLTEMVKLLRFSTKKLTELTSPTDYRTADMIRRMRRILRKYDNDKYSR
jgi:hypothetical protein